MKLKSVQIGSYKCIRKPCTFDVSDITCLVGKNESGKTAILEALYRLNPIIAEQASFDVDDDFPRIDVEDYRLEVEGGQREPAIVTRATFSLEEADLAELEKDFPGILARPELVLSKGYRNELYAELVVNDELAVENLLKSAHLDPQVMKALARCSSLAELAEALKAPEYEASAKELLALVGQIQEKGLLDYLYSRYLEQRVPKFLYFDEFYQMEGHVNIQALRQRQQENRLLDSDYPFLGLIDLARLDLQEIDNPKRALERDNRLEGASNHLTRRLMKYWSQNRYLEMRFDIRPALPDDPEGMQSGTNLWGHVYNSRQKVKTLLGRRSKGFVWFFSFLAWFSQQKKRGIPIILLLDEPSLFLHAAAQRDLLRFLEDESKSGQQVIYTTQSPHMIDPLHLDRVRIVEDKGAEAEEAVLAGGGGTQVYADVLEASRESILPLQGALGHALHRELFPAGSLLAVSGIPELLFLKGMSGLLWAQGRTGLDPRWSITPVGGAQNLPVFVALLEPGSERIMAFLAGSSGSANGPLEDMLRRNLLRKQNVVFLTDFTQTSAADIEDMLEPDFYLGLVNGAYGELLARPVSKGHLRGGGRMRELLERHLVTAPLKNGARFDPFLPARYFVENSARLEREIPKDSLGRFEKAFQAVNALLR
jgi:hypothetical protein